MLNFIESIEVKPEVHIETKSQFTLTSGTQNDRNTESQRKSIFDVVQRDSKGLQLDSTNNDKISDSGNYITVDLSKRTEQDAIDHLDRIVYKTKFSIYNGEIEENKCKGIKIICGGGQSPKFDKKAIQYCIQEYLSKQGYTFVKDVANGIFTVEFQN